MKAIAVIGKNFGDEGKGLVCASFAKKEKRTLIVKHNGGGQAGHTVEDESGKRFIHHQIGSGAEYGADTLLADTFLIDLFQLGNELKEFETLYGFTPKIYAEKNTRITVIDDVLRNMFIESARGKDRHGSCGMGINECLNRHECGLVLTVCDVRDKSLKELIDTLIDFRNKYGQKNLDSIKSLFEENNPGEKADYYDMLTNSDVLANFAESIKETVKHIEIIDASTDFLLGYSQVVFETGQGLLLDNDYKKFAPYLTPSKTGLWNIAAFLEKRDLKLDCAVYVTRSYVTRHGNGPLPGECDREEFPGVTNDLTNIDNEWQGSIRYARHQDIEDFVLPVKEDITSVEQFRSMKETEFSIFITHLNETDDSIFFKGEEIPFDKLKDILKTKYGFYNVCGIWERY
ncbi:adenylosuccinate synthetase [Butyrivibrio sp. AE2015]|uniref:adenylosuccinate synthetase n=1 Tax=Butyrivibrio sp. AE2015 TaxID=1280663 RepID=UPI0003B54C03|nr:adenylosuccinate synthetase [Butyrivibrio sp. AE2015]